MTRLAPLLPLLLLLVAGCPPVQAQESAAHALLLEDGPGDVTMEANGSPATLPPDRFAATDVRALAITEDPLDFTFVLTVGDLEPDAEGPLVESTYYTIDFAHQDRLYRVWGYRNVLTGSPMYFAALGAYDASQGGFDQSGELPIAADAAQGTLSITVPRDLLLDSDGAAPFPGRSLTGFHVRASGFVDLSEWGVGVGPFGRVPLPPMTIHDRMPDAGNGTLDWAVRFGLAQSGDVRLSSKVPVRASNGEATTFLFEVNATNTGPAQRVRLEASGVPATWHVELPADGIELPAQGTVGIPVLVSTPFAHEHGRLQGFVITATGADDLQDVGRVRLGVRYLSPPQPAGHHDTVYIHTAPPQGDETLNTAFGTAFGGEWRDLYFNTVTPDEEDGDLQIPVGGSLTSIQPGPPPRITYTWRIPLSPALQMGLDFDLGRTGTLNLAVDSLLPMPGAVVTGRIIHTAPDGRQDCSDGCTSDDFYFGYGTHATVGTVGPSPAVDVGPNAVGAAIEAPVVALPAGDYLPFQPVAGLGLEVNLTFTRVDPFLGPHDAPKISGGEMVLPLLEYHDPVDQVFSSLAGLMIAVDGEAERLVNPGKTVLFDLALMNHGTEESTFDLQLTGTKAEWAFIVGDARVTVAPGETRQLGVAVTAPASAADGEMADLVFAAVDADDPAARTLARLAVVVDADAEHPDDAARVPGLQERLSSKDSPGPPWPALAAALALAAVALRRRRA